MYLRINRDTNKNVSKEKYRLYTFKQMLYKWVISKSRADFQHLNFCSGSTLILSSRLA